MSAERFADAIPHQLYAGDTALHIAAAAARPDVVSALLDAGADVNAVNRRGATALHYACDPRPSAGRTWDWSAQRAVIERLLDAGSDIERVERSGATPLRRAIRSRSPEAVRCLLERGAAVNSARGAKRTTLLQLASQSTGASGVRNTEAEQQAIVALLVKYGAE